MSKVLAIFLSLKSPYKRIADQYIVSFIGCGITYTVIILLNSKQYIQNSMKQFLY